MGLCWLHALLYVLGGTGIHLILGVLFAVAALGLRNRKRWAGTLAATLAAIAGLLETMYLIAGRGGSVGTVLRLLLHAILLTLLVIIWEKLSDRGEQSNLRGRGTV
jgi:hypothetical protein